MCREAEVSGTYCKVLDINFGVGIRSITGSQRISLLQAPTVGLTSATNFIEIFLTADDHGFLCTAHPERFCEDRTKISPSNAKQSSFNHSLNWICQRTQQIKDGPPS